MARKYKEDDVKVGKKILLGFIALAVILVIGRFSDVDFTQETDSDALEDTNNTVATVNSSQTTNGNLVIDFIDVGQGDSILIRQGDATMLIDGGTSECKDSLLSFLQSENIDKFGTHSFFFLSLI